MYYILGTPKSVSLLKGKEIKPLGELRQAIPILVIDDQGFAYEEILRNHNFQIKVWKDITDLKATQSYPIIICDIKGVGGAFKSDYEGAHILSELRKLYPNKYLIAYTGELFDASYNSYFEMCDDIVKKDADSEKWIETLDQAISSNADPIEQWKKVRNALVKKDINTVALLKLEDSYVSSLLQNKAPFQDPSKLIDLPADIKSVILGIASNWIFKTIWG